MKTLIFAIITFCFFATPTFSMNKSKSPTDEVMLVIKKYSDLVAKSDEVLLRGHGFDYAGQDKVYDGKIHEISLGYSIDKNLKHKDARKKFYAIVDGLIHEINNNKSISKYFYHFPIGYQDLHFSLSFDYDNRGYLERDDVKRIIIENNEITYFILNKDGVTNKLQTKETYPGMGMLTFSDKDSIRVIEKKLPENDMDSETP
jgi:hypothetical protein